MKSLSLSSVLINRKSEFSVSLRNSIARENCGKHVLIAGRRLGGTIKNQYLLSSRSFLMPSRIVPAFCRCTIASSTFLKDYGAKFAHRLVRVYKIANFQIRENAIVFHVSDLFLCF